MPVPPNLKPLFRITVPTPRNGDRCSWSDLNRWLWKLYENRCEIRWTITCANWDVARRLTYRLHNWNRLELADKPARIVTWQRRRKVSIKMEFDHEDNTA